MSLARILVATDFSGTSNHALSYAAALARQYHARIFLAHVLTAVDEFGRADNSSTSYQAQRQAAERAIADILASGQLEGVSHEVLPEEGFLWQTLDKLVGARAGRPLAPHLPQAASYTVTVSAPCPLITVRA